MIRAIERLPVIEHRFHGYPLLIADSVLFVIFLLHAVDLSLDVAIDHWWRRTVNHWNAVVLVGLLEQVLECGDIFDCAMECFHFGQPFVAVLHGNAFTQFHERAVHCLHALTLASVAPRDHLDRFVAVRNVLVVGFAGLPVVRAQQTRWLSLSVKWQRIGHQH